MEPKPEFLIRIILDDDGAINAWWYRREDCELKDIGSKDCVLLHN
jgi:hypothetical protein